MFASSPASPAEHPPSSCVDSGPRRPRPIRVLLHGKIDTGPGGGIRNTFTVVPDAPVTKFVLSLKGGSKGLIQNSENVCAHPGHAVAKFDAQNGKFHDTNPPLATNCRTAARHHHKHH